MSDECRKTFEKQFTTLDKSRRPNWPDQYVNPDLQFMWLGFKHCWNLRQVLSVDDLLKVIEDAFSKVNRIEFWTADQKPNYYESLAKSIHNAMKAML